jgi:hypothetical protein
MCERACAYQDLTASAAAAVQAAADAAAQAEARLTQSLEDLRSMINTSGESDRTNRNWL